MAVADQKLSPAGPKARTMTEGDLWFFDRFARPYAWFMPKAALEPLEHGLAAARRPIERVVDLAGGQGRGAAMIEAPDRLVIDAAGGMVRRVPAGIGAVQGDARAVPLRDETADAVLIVDALHHLPAPEVVLDEVLRVLRPGGVVVVREFDRGTLRGRLVEAIEHLVGFESTFFTADELATRLDAAGFDARVTDLGFTCTVVGTKPGSP